jgi:hypothetical protein
MRFAERWGVVVGVALASACGGSPVDAPSPPVDVTRVDGGTPPGQLGAACVDPQLALTGPSSIAGSTPGGAFAANGARAFGRCLWLQFVSVATIDGRACQAQLITAATGLRVPPFFEGSRLAVGISLAAADGSAMVASGTLTIDGVIEGTEATVLKGSLVAHQPDWSLEGTFEAPWTDLPCKQ